MGEGWGKVLKEVVLDYFTQDVMFLSVCTEGHQLVIEFNAYKERLLEELFDVYSARDRRKTMSFVFHARVLGQRLLIS